jgi:hypothetical protein
MGTSGGLCSPLVSVEEEDRAANSQELALLREAGMNHRACLAFL